MPFHTKTFNFVLSENRSFKDVVRVHEQWTENDRKCCTLVAFSDNVVTSSLEKIGPRSLWSVANGKKVKPLRLFFSHARRRLKQKSPEFR